MKRYSALVVGVVCLVTGLAVGFGFGSRSPRDAKSQVDPEPEGQAPTLPAEPFLEIQNLTERFKRLPGSVDPTTINLHEWRLRAYRVGRLEASVYMIEDGKGSGSPPGYAQRIYWESKDWQSQGREETWHMRWLMFNDRPFVEDRAYDSDAQRIVALLYFDYGDHPTSRRSGEEYGGTWLFRTKGNRRSSRGLSFSDYKWHRLEPGKPTVVSYVAHYSGDESKEYNDLKTLDDLKRATKGSARIAAVLLQWDPIGAPK